MITRLEAAEKRKRMQENDRELATSSVNMNAARNCSVIFLHINNNGSPQKPNILNLYSMLLHTKCTVSG